MKYLLFYLSLTLSVFASFEDIYSFQADFLQTVTDDKNKVLTYDGNISASKPQNALWNYKNPVNKSVYINSDSVTIVEPEIEQVIIKKLESSFNFFNMLKNSKKIKKDTYLTEFKGSKFTITTKSNLLYSISYIDEFENRVKIVFNNQKYNIEIDENLYLPLFSLDFDVIQD